MNFNIGEGHPYKSQSYGNANFSFIKFQYFVFIRVSFPMRFEYIYHITCVYANCDKYKNER